VNELSIDREAEDIIDGLVIKGNPMDAGTNTKNYI